MYLKPLTLWIQLTLVYNLFLMLLSCTTGFMDSCNAQKILVIDFIVLKRRRWYRRGKVTTFEYHIPQHLVRPSLVYDSVNCSAIAWSNLRNSGWPEEVCGCPVCWFGRLMLLSVWKPRCILCLLWKFRSILRVRGSRSFAS